MVRIFSGKRSGPKAIPLSAASTALQPAKKSHPAVMIELLIKGPCFSIGEVRGPFISDDELSAFRRRVHREQNVTAPAVRALPDPSDAACAVACALHDQLPFASAAPSGPQ